MNVLRHPGTSIAVVLATLTFTSVTLIEARHSMVKTFTIAATRDMRFGELLVVKPNGIEVYNTTGLNDCPADLWDAMDLENIRKQFGALKVEKNGPHFWMMDSQTVSLGETVAFGGLTARWAATLDPAAAQKSSHGSVPYEVFTSKKTQKMVYSKGKPVYELVDSYGNSYVMQAHDERFPIDSLAKLGEQDEAAAQELAIPRSHPER